MYEKAIHILIKIAIFLIPYTTIRIAGLKLSEIFVVIAMPLIILTLKVRKNNYIVKFLIWFSISIILSVFVNFLDGDFLRKVGLNFGLYYSYEYGFIFKIVRFLIVGIFCVKLGEIIENKVEMINNIEVYITSTTLINLWGIFKTIISGNYKLGVHRNSLFAVEPSEAGFINSFSIIYLFFDIFWNKNRSKFRVIQFLIHILMHLFIGSAASILFVIIAILTIVIAMLIRDKSSKSKVALCVIVFCGIIVIRYLYSETMIFTKIIEYDKYMNLRGSSLVERITAIETGFEMFKDNYLAGVGWGNYGWFVDVYKTNPLYITVPSGKFSANNQYIVILSELGIVGFSIFLIFIKDLINTIRKSVRINLKKENQNFIVLFAIASLVYIALSSMTLNTIYSFQFWICIAYINALSGENVESEFNDYGVRDEYEKLYECRKREDFNYYGEL